MLKTLRFIPLLLLSHFAFAQDAVTITDPEIEFSFRAPNDWIAEDDGFYYILTIPNGNGLEQLSITYFETNETSPDDQFEGITKGMLPAEEPNYKLLHTGDDMVDGQPAKWAVFTSTIEGTEVKSMLYMFISCGQIFRIKGTTKLENFDTYKAQFQETIHSLKARRI
jgi:hypothetical protein